MVHVNLVMLALILGRVRLITNATLPSEMVLIVHVLPASVLTAEVWFINLI